MEFDFQLKITSGANHMLGHSSQKKLFVVSFDYVSFRNDVISQEVAILILKATRE